MNKPKIIENMTNQQIHFSNNIIDRQIYYPIYLFPVVKCLHIPLYWWFIIWSQSMIKYFKRCQTSRWRVEEAHVLHSNCTLHTAHCTRVEDKWTTSNNGQQLYTTLTNKSCLSVDCFVFMIQVHKNRSRRRVLKHKLFGFG